MDILGALLGTVVFLTLALAVELVAPLGKVSWKSRLLGLQITLLKALAVALMVPALNAGWGVIGVQPINLDLSLGAIAGVAVSVLAYDFLAYWHHRFLHRFFWPVHSTHHSIRELSALNSYAHFAEKVSQFALMLVPLSIVRWGSPATPFAISFVISLSEYWIHSPTKAQLHGLGGVIVTPRFHRIHHSLESQHFDKNFGILFSFWDRLFGTAFEPRRDEWPATGLAGHAEPNTLFRYVIHPLVFLFKRRRAGQMAIPASSGVENQAYGLGRRTR